MGIIEDIKKVDADRAAANALKTIDAIEKQTNNDSLTVNDLKAKIKTDIAKDVFNLVDLTLLIDAMHRISNNNSKLFAYKTDLATLKENLSRDEYKTELQTKIDEL